MQHMTNHKHGLCCLVAAEQHVLKRRSRLIYNSDVKAIAAVRHRKIRKKNALWGAFNINAKIIKGKHTG